MEGGVVSIFVKRKINNQMLLVFGDGTQTRDLLYVEDCSNFIYKTSKYDKCLGEILNAGKDISMNELAKLIIKDTEKIQNVEHHHPQSEIMKLVCNSSKAREIRGWEPNVSLEEGIKILENWIKENDVEI